MGASLKSWNDEGYEIPIAISTTNNVNPVIDEESVEQLAISESTNKSSEAYRSSLCACNVR